MENTEVQNVDNATLDETASQELLEATAGIEPVEVTKEPEEAPVETEAANDAEEAVEERADESEDKEEDVADEDEEVSEATADEALDEGLDELVEELTKAKPVGRYVPAYPVDTYGFTSKLRKAVKDAISAARLHPNRIATLEATLKEINKHIEHDLELFKRLRG